MDFRQLNSKFIWTVTATDTKRCFATSMLNNNKFKHRSNSITTLHCYTHGQLNINKIIAAGCDRRLEFHDHIFSHDAICVAWWKPIINGRSQALIAWYTWLLKVLKLEGSHSSDTYIRRLVNFLVKTRHYLLLYVLERWLQTRQYW